MIYRAWSKKYFYISMNLHSQQHPPLTPYTETRPWGAFTEFTKNEPSTVKIITVNDGGELSLQYHHHRDEFWYIVSGVGVVTIGDEHFTAHVGEKFFIPRKTNHRAKGVGGQLVFMEISFGEFDEKDIVRLEDHYGRLVQNKATA